MSRDPIHKKVSKKQPKTLLLLRQGKADTSEGKHESALMKPLDDAGKRNAQRMGAWLAGHDLIADEVLCSSAERAIISAEKCVKSMGSGVQDLRIDHHLFKASAKRFIKIITGLPTASGCVLMVADGTGIEALLRYLGVVPDTDKKTLSPTSLAVLRIDSGWPDVKPGAVRLERCIHAADLPRQFPYPDARGEQRRDRPAYYYRQSAVIPYRLKHKRVEIMLITSSSNKHWVVPKGIQEPGLSARDSAAKEALEEAGIEGIVRAKSLGKYDHAKWGNVCQVKVFPMHVGHVLNKKQWQESHRKRQWCSIKKARTLLDQQTLIAMLDKLAVSIGR